MGNYPSNTTLYPPQEVARRVGVSTPTLYSWLESGLVKNAFDIQGRPVFSEPEIVSIAALVEHRRALAQAIKLPPVPA